VPGLAVFTPIQRDPALTGCWMILYRGALHLCSGSWHSEIWTNVTVL